MALPSLTLRNTKGSALTYTELDNNFTNLSTATTKVTVGSTTTTLSLNDTLTLTAGSNVTLTGNSATKTVTIAASGGSGITALVQDTAPQLGGNLDINGRQIVTAAGSNANIVITPDGTGDVLLSADTVQFGDGGASEATITNRGTGLLTLNCGATGGTNSPKISLGSGISTAVQITATGTANINLATVTGIVQLDTPTLRVGTGAAQALITSNSTQALKLATNNDGTGASIIIGNGANANVELIPNATGNVKINANYWPQATGTAGQVLTVATSTAYLYWTTPSAGGAVADSVYTGSTTFSGTLTPSITSGTIHTYTLTGNLTLNAASGMTSGQTITLYITQDSTGSRSLSSTMKFSNGYKTLSTAAGATDMISITYVGTTYYATLVKGYA